MKNEDEVIVSLLRGNCRISLTEMSKVTKIPISTIYDKMKSYNNGIIHKHTALIDFSQLGFSARARVLLKVKKTEMEKLREHLLKCPALNELYKINNGYDFMAEFIFKTMREMEEHIDTLGQFFGVEKEEVFYIIDELKREQFLSKANILLVGQKK
ncbi:MAG: Lrp/AsnC family transcriptional regulator [bacterium]|nr:Lrp/AsnC family transcriptional regulator [bacterium]